MKNDRSPEEMEAFFAETLSGDLEPKLREGLELMQKGLAGDESAGDAAIVALAHMKGIGPSGMAMPSLAEQHADPVELARKALLKAVHGELEVLQQLGRERLQNVERDLSGPNPTPIERMLAEQASLCWLELYHLQGKYAHRLNVEPKAALGFAQQEFYQKQVARAQSRFQSALKCLAQVRRLQLPTVQLNVAKNQINVGSGQVKVGEAQVNVLADSMAGD